MKIKIKQILAIKTIILLILISTFPLTSSEKINTENASIELLEEEVELNLLRVEHRLQLKANENTETFNVKYAFPPDYQYQVPILLHVFSNSTADIISYKIENDILEPNKFVTFTVGPMTINEKIWINFTAWVLVENKDFSDLPESKPFPIRSSLPEDTKKWLTPTEVTQSDSLLIRIRAKLLRGLNDNMLQFAYKISQFIRDHRYLLFILQLKLGIFFRQDAKTTLFINGENVGRSHLACALLRSQDIPSRVLLVNNDQGFWTQMHYMVEYYVQDYGWVLLETTRVNTPFPTKRQVINRICHPEDEEDTKTDYIFRFMKGEERWIWLETEKVQPNYIDCRKGSKSQMFSEQEVSACISTAEKAFYWTRETFSKYQRYLGMELSPEDLEYFENAVEFQQEAINSLINKDPDDYHYFIRRASEEYDKI